MKILNRPTHPEESRISGCAALLIGIATGTGFGGAFGILFGELYYGLLVGFFVGIGIGSFLSKPPKATDSDKIRAELLKKFVLGLLLLLAGIVVFVYLYWYRD